MSSVLLFLHALLNTFISVVNLLVGDELPRDHLKLSCFVGSLYIGFNDKVSLYFEVLPLIQRTYILSSEESFLLLAVNLRFCLFNSVSLSYGLNVRF